MPKDKFILPPGWEWKGEWELAPELSLLFDKDAGHTQYMEEIYENSYRSIPGASWNPCHSDKKPYYWTDYVIYRILQLNILTFKAYKFEFRKVRRLRVKTRSN